MLNHRRKIVELLSSGTWLRSKTGRILSGLVLAINAPQVADVARGAEGRAAKRGRDNDEARNNRDTREETKKSESESDHQNDGKASAETSDSRAKSDKAAKRNQDESTDENDDTREQRAADAGKTRGETRRNTDSDSDSSKTSAEDQDSHQHAGRRFREFEQQANDAPAADEPDVTTVTPANPNVIINDVPSSPIADLVVEANDDVIAQVSTGGGFAFARSGDVIAVSGPDGASIVHTGDVTTGTSGTSPAEPSDDGGNNDVEFSS